MTPPGFLFVDEDPRALSALRRLVRSAPGLTRSALGMAEALSLVSEQPPAVLVSGAMLPDGDGLGLLRLVRERHPQTACALHTARPPSGSCPGGITWMDRLAPPGELQTLLLLLLKRHAVKVPPLSP